MNPIKSVRPRSEWRNGPRIGVLALLCIAIPLAGCAKKGFPDKFKADRDAFDQSIEAFWQAGDMFKRHSGQPIVMRTPDQEAKYFSLIDKGITLGDRISDEFLDYAHPELRQMYRDVLIPGKRLYADGARNDNRVMQTDGAKKVLEWDEYWEAHQKEIADRIYPGTGPPH